LPILIELIFLCYKILELQNNGGSLIVIVCDANKKK